MDFEKEIGALIHSACDVETDSIILEVPSDSSHGDYAFPCFTLSKIMSKAPQKIAEELAGKLKLTDNIVKTEAKGPYVNFFVNPKKFARDVIEKINKEGTSYGKSAKRKDSVMVEFCQVNTHKAFHVGHLRGTLIGSSLINILRFAGFNAVGANYQGDIGAHVAKSLWYLTKHYTGDYPSEHKGIWLGEIYQKANLLLSENEDKYKPEVSEVLQKLESGDAELTELWKTTKQWSLNDFEEIYARLGVKFDEYFFESQMEKSGKELVKKMLNEGLAKKSEGAVIIDLKEYKLGVFLLLKKDGTALYSTKDLELARKKFEKYKIDRSIHVVGSEQKYYFQQLFKTLELMGFSQAKKCFHLPYDLLTLEGGKISSREGELILAVELLDEAFRKAYKAVKDRHSDLEDIEITKIANMISLAGIKFVMLSQDNNKQIVFNMEKALDFEGETGPYIQYVHARICSILRKEGGGEANLELLGDEEKQIVSILSGFPKVIEDCASHYKVTILCRYLLNLSQSFNEYYHKTPILKADVALKNARLSMIKAVRQVLCTGLGILGIKSPEIM